MVRQVKFKITKQVNSKSVDYYLYGLINSFYSQVSLSEDAISKNLEYEIIKEFSVDNFEENCDYHSPNAVKIYINHNHNTYFLTLDNSQIIDKIFYLDLQNESTDVLWNIYDANSSSNLIDFCKKKKGSHPVFIQPYDDKNYSINPNSVLYTDGNNKVIIAPKDNLKPIDYTWIMEVL